MGSVSTSTFKMLQNQFLNGGSGSTTNVQPERLSRSNDDLVSTNFYQITINIYMYRACIRLLIWV